ncbi:MAG: methyltransferase domain-containing protein [Acidobacteria bacterium]|nr:methyltransferase domain-containing protein [Acidobacteriota bacterium]
MVSSEVQKQRAIDTHSEQATLFASRYDVIKQDPYQNCFVYSRKRLNEWLDQFLPPRGDGLEMLDVGCGTGYHMARYRARGFRLTGIDGSADMLRQARELNPDIVFYQSDVDRLPVAETAFDLAFSIEVLRYLPDIQPCVREIHRILRPGGTALVTAAPPLQASIYPPVNRLAVALKLKSLTALKQYFHSAGELERSFRAAGFQDVEVHGVYGGAMIWLERLLPASVMPGLLRGWEKIDRLTADAPVFRHFSNMFLVRAVKGK